MRIDGVRVPMHLFNDRDWGIFAQVPRDQPLVVLSFSRAEMGTMRRS